MNQASMFFTALVMLAGAGWYVLASNSPPAGDAAAASAEKPAQARFIAQGPASARE